jgi:hypothetical protein
MKKLLFLCVLVSAAVGLFRNSPHYSVYSLQKALEQGNATEAERFADFEALSKIPAELAVSAATDGAQGIGAAIAGVLGGLLGTIAQNVGGGLVASEIKVHIAKKDIASFLAGYQPSGVSLISGIQSTTDGALVTLNGKCQSKTNESIDMPVVLIFKKIPGSVMGYFPTYKATAVEQTSLKNFAKNCTFKL